MIHSWEEVNFTAVEWLVEQCVMERKQEAPLSNYETWSGLVTIATEYQYGG